MIPRSSKPLKRTPLPKRTKAIRKRSRSKAERLRIYGPPGYVEWCKSQPCVACFTLGGSEVAHIRTGGTGRKDDWTRTIPLCGPQMNGWLMQSGCHRLLHQIGRYAFEDRMGIDLETEAKRIQELWASSVLEDTK